MRRVWPREHHGFTSLKGAIMQTKTKTTIAAVIAAAGFAGLMPSAQAQTTIIRVAPPPVVTEVAPPLRPGHTWVAGHHEWRSDHYAWGPGYWTVDRPGYAYTQPHYVQNPDGTWRFVAGTWQGRGMGDRDRDGVANRNDRDRDGDGVQNRYDRFPNDPNRS